MLHGGRRMDTPHLTGLVYRARVNNTPLTIRIGIRGDQTHLHLTFEGTYGEKPLMLVWYESYHDGRRASETTSEGISISFLLDGMTPHDPGVLHDSPSARLYLPYSEKNMPYAWYPSGIQVRDEHISLTPFYTALPFLSEKNRQRRMRIQHLSYLDDLLF